MIVNKIARKKCSVAFLLNAVYVEDKYAPNKGYRFKALKTENVYGCNENNPAFKTMNSLSTIGPTL